VSASRIPKLLECLRYRRQVNRKTKEGSRHPDRDAQFEHINHQVVTLQAAGQPVISVDTKKKELIGAYKNAGSDYRPQGCPDEVSVEDSPNKELGKVFPWGVYDLAGGGGCGGGGFNPAPAVLAVKAIGRGQKRRGCEFSPPADRLMITADGGGS